MPRGAAELIEEVSSGKITGEEDRYSKTDLYDFNANLEGSQAAIERLAPALREADPRSLPGSRPASPDLQTTLAPLRDDRRLEAVLPRRTTSTVAALPRGDGAAVDGRADWAQLASLSENVRAHRGSTWHGDSRSELEWAGPGFLAPPGSSPER